MQRINLLNVLPVEAKIKLSAQVLLRTLLGVVVGLALWTLLGKWQHAQLLSREVQLKQRQQQLAQVVTRLTKLQKNPVDDADEAAERPVVDLAQQVRNHSKLIAVLKKNEAMNLTGFSSTLQAIAAAMPRGVWLKHITVKRGAHYISLVGQAEDSSLVIKLVDQLNHRHELRGQSFHVVGIEQPTANVRYYQYEVKSGEDASAR